jgi:hypothetical protein
VDSKLPVPTEADWGDYRADLDQASAHDRFAGRTNEEMLPHFSEHVIERTGELRWMPTVPFRYYMIGFRDFVMAREFKYDDGSDAASCFLNLVAEKLEAQPDHVLPIMRELLPAVRYVAENQALFEADESIYGSFRRKRERIEALYTDRDVPQG